MVPLMPLSTVVWISLTFSCVIMTSSSTKPSSHCAVKPAGIVGQCWCNSLLEAYCRDIQSMPEIEPEVARSVWMAGYVYRGLYLGHQHIGALPLAAFRLLPVNRIVLNFNNFGENIHEDAFTGFVSNGSPNGGGEGGERGGGGWGHYNSDASSYNAPVRHASNILGQTLLELYMGSCNIRQIPQKLFWPLASLERLHLWANRIDTLQPGLFRRNTKLVELSLWGNRIEEIEPNAFDGLRSLRYLDLDRNHLTSLPSNSAISRLGRLIKLSLNGNRIHALSPDLFRNIHELRALSLDSNGLGYVYDSSLRNAVNLTTLSVRRNQVHILPDDTFVNLERLTNLLLDKNRIEHVWAGTFHGLRSLVRLSMKSNKLDHLPDGTFRDLSNLRYVYLDDNSLTSLRRCVLCDSSLARLSLDMNRMTCDCRMSWLYSLVQRQRLSVSGTCNLLANASSTSLTSAPSSPAAVTVTTSIQLASIVDGGRCHTSDGNAASTAGRNGNECCSNSQPTVAVT